MPDDDDDVVLVGAEPGVVDDDTAVLPEEETEDAPALPNAGIFSKSSAGIRFIDL